MISVIERDYDMPEMEEIDKWGHYVVYSDDDFGFAVYEIVYNPDVDMRFACYFLDIDDAEEYISNTLDIRRGSAATIH